MIERAAKKGCKIVCLGELFNVRYPQFCVRDSRAFATAEPEDGPTLSALRTVAKKNKVYVIAPVFERTKSDAHYNTAFVINQKGEVQGRYRKTHIPESALTGSQEKFYFKPGNEFPVFDTPFGRFGILICWDRQFPEAWRALGMGGAEIVIVPSATFQSSRTSVYSDSWKKIATAAAYFNQVFAIVINRTGNEDGLRFFGRSLVVNPYGRIIAEGSAREEMLVGQLDLAEVHKARIDVPLYRDLRTDLYRKTY